ncbi:MAG: hypothetical protein DID90_2727554710 [Candidatus Nitrotoga sp. LAW]|nr:MAG: hypothetical protein DID90_2727554710 [Candidatus Nitrotoga sp. LAW]
MRKQKLELTWIGKRNQYKLGSDILLEDPAKSYYVKHRVKNNGILDNQVVQKCFGLRGSQRRQALELSADPPTVIATNMMLKGRLGQFGCYQDMRS